MLLKSNDFNRTELQYTQQRTISNCHSIKEIKNQVKESEVSSYYFNKLS